MAEKDTPSCGECVLFQRRECPRYEYKDPKMNQAACAPWDKPCEKFKLYNKRKKGVKVNSEKSKADLLVELVIQNDIVLFHDNLKVAYARITLENGSSPIMKIRSRHFKVWLARARSNGLWIDMVDDKSRAIHIISHGWEIVNIPPILFRRFSHQSPLAEPKRNGDYKHLIQFLNTNEEDTLLLLLYIVTCFLPQIPHPILILHGIQGSSKSTLMKIIRSLIDPSALPLCTIQKNEKERTQHLHHNWLAYYDNVSVLSGEMSDTFCRACTGGGLVKRTLYTDEEDTIFNFLRCVGINGINMTAWRPDLIDRSLIIELKHIPEDKRRTTKEFWNKFNRYRSSILGGLLDLLVKALKIYPTIELKTKHRMADFTVWGCAITKAIGYDKQFFLDIYGQKINSQVEEAAHTNLVSLAINELIKDRKRWIGTPTQLFGELNTTLRNLDISTRQKGWPKAPNSLTRQINRLIPSLDQIGIKINTYDRTSEKRQILIENLGSTVTPSLSSQNRNLKNSEKSFSTEKRNKSGLFLNNYFDDGNDDNDDISSSFKHVEFNELLDSIQGICEVCGSNALLTHSFNYDGKRRLCCSSCIGERKKAGK